MKKVLPVVLILVMNLGVIWSESSKGQIVFSSPEVEKTMELVEQLEGHGYDRSAVHYLKKTLRNEKLESGERAYLEDRLKQAEQRMSQAELKVLPDLEVMIHFDRPPPVVDPKEVGGTAALMDTTPLPKSYPSNRINKKKWLLVATAVVVTGAIAYKVTKHLRQKKEKPPNMVTIQF